MKERPTIETPRLVLRPFTLADAPQVQRLASERETWPPPSALGRLRGYGGLWESAP